MTDTILDEINGLQPIAANQPKNSAATNDTVVDDTYYWCPVNVPYLARPQANLAWT